jgi:HAE1 family hydrophobic/amphiphilic exporter-1
MKYFLENRISAYMLFAGCLIFGIIGLVRLPLALMPQVNYPGLTVIVEYPGITPDKIETIITKPIEQIIRTVPGIESIQSVSEEGKSRINVNFHIDTDIKIAALNVREKIGLLRGSFPRAVQEPMVIRYDPSDRSAVIAAVERIPDTKATLTDIREYAERVIKPRLQRIEGVSEIFVAGGLQKEIHVSVDPGKFSSRSLDFDRVFKVLQEGGISLPAGLLAMGGKDYQVRTPERFRSLSEIANTVIHTDESGRTIRVSDFSEVTDSHREADDIARHNGQERVLIYLHKSGEANTLQVSGDAAKVFADAPGCDIRVIYSQGDYIRAAVGNVVRSGLWGLVIVVLVVYLFYRNFTRALIISLSIPFSIITVFACMYFAKIPIDVISLSGLALAAGMVVDNSILIMESIGRRGLDPESVYRGIREVTTALAASTATTVAVFFPIVFGDEMTRRIYSGMAFTVSSALVISFFVAIIFIPVLHLDMSKHEDSSSLSSPKISPIAEAMRSRYKSALEYAFSNRRTVYSAAAIIIVFSALCLILTKSEFIDPFSTDEFYVYCEFPTGTTLGATNDAVKLVERHIQVRGIADKVSTKVEKWRGTIAVTLKEGMYDQDDRSAFKKRLGEEANALLQPSRGFAFISESDEISARELNLTFIGADNEKLKEIARDAAKRIQSIPGIDECVLRFREGKPSYRIRVDRGKTGMTGVSISRIAQFFHSALYGPVAIKHIASDREIDVRVMFDRKEFTTLDGVLNTTIMSDTGAPVPLKELVTVEEGTEATRIWRHNGRRAVTITARIGTLSFDEAAEKIETALGSLTLPPEYIWEFDDTLNKTRKSRRLMMILTLFSILLVFMIIAGLLESLKLPLLIITTVPLAFCGVFIALFLTGSTMNVAAYIGMIVLTGIAVNNGIVLVERIRASLPDSGTLAPSVIDETAAAVSLEHFNPVIITTITTVMGFLPALLSGGAGSNLWCPLALTVVSGMSFSTAIIIFIIPISIRYFFAFSRRIR